MSEPKEPETKFPYSIIGPYFDALGRNLAGLDGKHVKAIFSRVFSSDMIWSLAETDSVHREICLALSDFSPRPMGLFKYLTVEQLTIALKLYVIAWVTLLDMLAGLINKSFDLGFADRDVNFDLLLRNQHVQNSELLVFKKHAERLDLKKFKQHRNEIVHRGKILDTEIKAAHVNRNVLDSKRYSLLNQTHISDEEYKKESAEQTAQLFELAAQKKDFYEAHYRMTLEMVSELLIVLAKKTVETSKARST